MGFYFQIFKEAFFCENKFPGPTVIQKYILMIKWNALSWLHYLCSINAFCSFIKQLLDPEGQESETLPSVSNKDANKAVHAGCSPLWNNRRSLVTIQIRQCPLNNIIIKILVTRHNNLRKYLPRRTRQFWNIFINMIVTHCLFLFTTELIVSAIFNSNSNTRKLIKILQNLQSSKI